MIHVTRILLPTDFSPSSAEAMRYACTLAQQFDAELHVLHVLEQRQSTTPAFGMGLALPSRVQETTAAAQQELERVLPADWAAGRKTVKAIAEGAPHREIVRYAADHQIDLIVLGTHGHTGLSHALLGSIAERVVRTAACPVLTVRLGDPGPVA
jgi:universal stress protein A